MMNLEMSESVQVTRVVRDARKNRVHRVTFVIDGSNRQLKVTQTFRMSWRRCKRNLYYAVRKCL